MLLQVIEYLLLLLGFRRLEGNHLQSLVLCRAGFDTGTAACTIIGRDCQSEFPAVSILSLHFQCSRTGLCRFVLGNRKRTDCTVRAHEGTHITLEAVFRNPLRNGNGHASLLECCRAGRNHSVVRLYKSRHRNGISFHCRVRNQYLFDVLFQIRSICLYGLVGRFLNRILPRFRYFYLMNMGNSGIHRFAVHGNDIFSLAAISLPNRFLHVFNRFINWNNFGQLEEGRLQYRVGSPSTQAQFHGDIHRITGVEPNIVLCNVSLCRCRKYCIQFFITPAAVQQEGSTRIDILHNLIFMHVGCIMAGNKVCVVYIIGGANRFIAETQVGDGNTAGFLRVVLEVRLNVFVGVVSDYFYAVFICTHCSVGTQPPELAGNRGWR